MNLPMLARTQIRLLTVAAVRSIVESDTQVQSPGAWTIPPAILPAIKVRAPRDSKLSIGKAPPEFTTTVTIEIEAAVQGEDEDEAQTKIDLLGARLEQALFTYDPLLTVINQFANVGTDTGVSSDGQRITGYLKMTLDVELPEMEWNVEFPPLAGVDIQVDLHAPFDANGNYGSTLFPASVPVAPREHGPDGRSEGELHVDLAT